MNLLIHIEINEINLLHFKKEITSWASDNLDNLTVFDFDNHSDPYIVDSALKLTKEADIIAVILDIKTNNNIGGTVKFLNALLRLKNEGTLVILNGQQETILKMTKAFRNHYLDLTLDVQKAILQRFFKA